MSFLTTNFFIDNLMTGNNYIIVSQLSWTLLEDLAYESRSRTSAHSAGPERERS